MRRRPLMTSAVLAAMLLLPACGGGTDDSGNGAGGDGGSTAPSAPGEAEGPEGPDPELVAWLGGFCTAYDDALRRMPAPWPNPGTFTEAQRQPLTDFLADADAALDGTTGALDALPGGPTPAAQELAERFRADVGALDAEVEEWSDLAVRVPVDSLEDVYIVASMSVMTFAPAGEGMGDYLADQPELTAAHEAAADCGPDGEPAGGRG